jgi:hypothetical protein
MFQSRRSQEEESVGLTLRIPVGTPLYRTLPQRPRRVLAQYQLYKRYLDLGQRTAGLRQHLYCSQGLPQTDELDPVSRIDCLDSDTDRCIPSLSLLRLRTFRVNSLNYDLLGILLLCWKFTI